jgi:hypothetical protein
MATQAKAPMTVTTRKSAVTGAPTTPTFTEEQIAAHAYEIFEREGSVHGNDEQHWFQAIEELTAELQDSKSSAEPALKSSTRWPPAS